MKARWALLMCSDSGRSCWSLSQLSTAVVETALVILPTMIAVAIRSGGGRRLVGMGDRMQIESLDAGEVVRVDGVEG